MAALFWAVTKALPEPPGVILGNGQIGTAGPGRLFQPLRLSILWVRTPLTTERAAVPSNDVGEGTEPTFVFAGGAKYLARLPASFNASLASKSGFEGTGPMYLAAFDHGGARPGSGTAGHLVDDEFSIPSGASRPPKNYRNFSGEAPSPSAYDHP